MTDPASSSLPPPFAPPSFLDTNDMPIEDPEIDVTSSNQSGLVVPKFSALTQSMIDSLREQGYTRGLIEALGQTCSSVALRLWVIDNSGSMELTDGTRMVMKEKGEINMISGCSRWVEMQQTLEYHARLAACIHAPTVFRLLNDPGITAGPQNFSVAMNQNPGMIDQELDVAIKTITNTSPSGVTPLVQQMKEVQEIVTQLEPSLRRDGTKVAIIIATDGLPSDRTGYTTDAMKRDFENALRQMIGMPVWIVIRLLTDQEDVVEFYNELDSRIELSIEVLDDFKSEAAEIHKHNKWLTYGLPLHRMREMGYSNPILDVLDEKKLSKEEVRRYCKIILGHGIMDEAPDPEIDWNGFYQTLKKALHMEKETWDPIDHRLEQWIDRKKLKKTYSPAGLLSFLH